MMQLLLPLGLLGLLSVAALIIIYIIKPNYQVKHINSTYVWKLSMKYKKKRLPTSTLRNILLLICQILILIAMTLIITQPAIVYSKAGDDNEVIAIIDSSTSMYTSTDGETRFSRAISKVEDRVNGVIDNGGQISVIVATDKPYFLRQRVGSEGRYDLISALEEMSGEEYACSFGDSDIDAAIELCEEVLNSNPSAQIEVFTDKSYQYVPKGVTINSVRGDGEWNVAILDAQTTLEDGYYQLTVQIASYGKDCNTELMIDVRGANAIDMDNGGRSVTFSQMVFCDADKTKTVIFRYGKGEETDDIYYYDLGDDQRFYSYRSIDIYIEEDDNLSLDNSFYLYGGLKEVVNVQYSSGDESTVGANVFVNNALSVIVDAFASRWDVKITEVQQGAEPAIEGFDFYIFEHNMPREMPTDGVVLLIDPLSAPIGSDIQLIRSSSFNSRPLAAENSEHPLMQNIIASGITVSRLTTLNHSNDYEVLMTCNGAPALIARNDRNVKTAILAFSLHDSNLPLLADWFVLMYNLFDYFLPSTVDGNIFEVNQQITVNARGDELQFSAYEDPIVEFPTTIVLDKPGTYSFDLETYFGRKAPTEYIFVRTPSIGSNICREIEALADPFATPEETQSFDDLLIYFAAALVALLFLEWWLQSRDKQ